MSSKPTNGWMSWLHAFSIVTLLIVCTFWFVFALLSGAQDYGGGVSGLIQNSPNAIPWIGLYIVIIMGWKWPLTGGVLVVSLGLLSVVQFDTYKHGLTFLLISLPLIALGLSLILVWAWMRPAAQQ
ncbi:MAG: hypothetical protein AAFV45_00115 [Pseudomonadota bacterium]